MTLLLAHPTPVIGDGLCAGLRDRLGVDVISVDSHSALLSEASSPEIRVALVDESLLDGPPEALCHALLGKNVAMILMTASHDGLLDVLACGVRGVVDLRGGLDGVVAAVRSVQEGLTHLPPHLLSTVLLELIVARRADDAGTGPVSSPASVVDLGRAPSYGRSGPTDLSHRELEVLALLHDGADQADIARSLTIATSTAKTHIARIMAKLGARTRVEAVEIAVRSKLITAEERRA